MSRHGDIGRGSTSPGLASVHSALSDARRLRVSGTFYAEWDGGTCMRVWTEGTAEYHPGVIRLWTDRHSTALAQIAALGVATGRVGLALDEGRPVGAPYRVCTREER